jgi:diguanylate cyclase (GGDEF)-like protein
MMQKEEPKLSARLGRLFAACLCGLLLAVGAARAQSHRFGQIADTVFYSITGDDGLPNQIPLAITQDSSGFIWIGTQGGLARWDGTHFKLYLAGPSPGTLPDNVVTVLHRDALGRLWIGTDAAGLARYDPATDTFLRKHLDLPGGGGGVWAIVDDGSDGVWVGTGAGLFHLDRSMQVVAAVVQRQAHQEPDHFGLPDFAIHSLLRDRHGALWVGTFSGLAVAEPGSMTFKPVKLPLPSHADSVCEVMSLMEDGKGAVWIGTGHDGAFVIGPDRGQAVAVPLATDDPGSTSTYGVNAMLEVRPGEVWLGTDGQGIIDIDDGAAGPRHIRHDPSIGTSLINDTVRTIYQDRSGLVWVGTDRGVSQYDPRQHAVATLFGVVGRVNGLSDPDILSILPMADGRVWIGLRYHGMDIIDPSTGSVQHVAVDPDHPQSALPPFAVTGLAALPGGAVLAGTASGLYRLNRTGTRIERLVIPGRPPAREILSLCVCHGSVWIGGKDGLFDLSVADQGDVRVLRHEDGATLTDPRVEVLSAGPDGEVWAGTPNGLNLVREGSEPIERIYPNRKDSTQLSSGEVISLVTDRLGRLWVGTLDGGVHVMIGRLDGRPMFRHLGKAQGLPNDDIGALELDETGRVWMSTDAGLAVVDPMTFGVQALGRAQGVAISTYWSNSGAVSSRGEIMFGGLGGMTVVTPSLIVHSDQHPPLVVTDVRVGGRPIWAGNPEAGSSVAPIVLGPQANSLHVEFTLLDYTAAANDRFDYRLEGFDPDWVENEITPRLAAYTNLPPGRYTLQIRGSDLEGSWGDAELALPIVVLPAWYQTPWFRLATLAVVALLVAALVQARTALLRQRQRELERQVAERTAELSLTQAQLRHFAYVDMLTGLPNRRAFTEEFRRLIEEAELTGSRLALLLIDMDGFKLVNDTLGHHAGDSLLVAVGGRLRGAVREGDFVARLGGDEFAVLLMMDDDVIEVVCQRIIDGFLPPIAIEGENLVAGASIGVAVYPEHGASQERIYKMADIAMYAAKRDGRGTWRCFEGTMQAA